MSSPVEKSFMAKFEAKLAEQPGEDEEFDLFASETEEERVEREKAVEDRRLAVARKEQEKQETYEKRRAAYERGETEPVKVDADTAIATGYNISQRHYADNGNKRFGTASALLCLAKAGVHPSDEQITKLANLLNDVLDEECSVKEAADKMS
jgi:prophage maintenance system killer protein